jgi:hypothetical protein
MKSILKPRASSPTPPPKTEPDGPQKYTPRGKGSQERIIVAVRNGTIDFKSMSADAAKEFNELMHKPEVLAQFGVGPLAKGFDPKHCKHVYSAVGNLLYGTGRYVFKLEPDACQLLHFTDSEKEELAQPTAEVLDEIAPPWLRENQALSALLLVLTSILQNKLRAAAQMSMEIRKARAAGQVVPPVVPQAGRIPVVNKVNGAAGPEYPFAGPGVSTAGDISGAAPRM